MPENDQTPKTAQEFAARAKQRLTDGDYAAAIADYDEAIRLDPNNAEYWNRRGYAKSKKGDQDAAITDYDQAIRLDPNHAKAWNNRGLAKSKNRDQDAAITDYNEAIRLQPDYAKAWNNRGFAKRLKKDYDGAIADYDEAIRLWEDYAEAWNNRGFAKSLKRDYDGAIADYDEAIRLDPNYESAVHNRATALGLQASEAERKEMMKRVELANRQEFSQYLQNVRERGERNRQDLKKLHDDNLQESKKYEGRANRLISALGIGLFVVVFLIFVWESVCVGNTDRSTLNPWQFLRWLPFITVISAPFFLLWWGLQRRRYECLALAHGFLSELIIEALIDSSSADEKSRYELAKLYIRHWMDKTPLEVMLTKGKNTEESASTSIVMEKILSALRNLAGRGGGGSDSPS